MVDNFIKNSYGIVLWINPIILEILKITFIQIIYKEHN